MRFKIGIENNVEGRSMAWALEHPGCFAYDLDADAAISAMPKAIDNYSAWIASRNQGVSWEDIDEIELLLDDKFDVYAIDDEFELVEEGNEINAWFRHDWKPLSEQDIAHGQMLLNWARADLLEAVSGLSQSVLEMKLAGERWSIAGILNHVGSAEWWYLDRLGLAMPRQELPSELFERLAAVRARLLEVLPTLAGSNQVVGVEGEFWSPRKLLRRAVWHERDHTIHIYKLR